jgi:hypothetical protein
MPLAALPREVQILALALGGGGDDDRIRALVERGVDWAALGWLADRERASSILWRRLAALPSALVPATEGARLRQVTLITDFQMLRLERRLDETLAQLSAAGIEVILLKGAALACTLYPSFALRPMHDVDLLVREERAAEAWALVRQCGWRWDHDERLDPFYAGHQHFPALQDEGAAGMRLELHTALFPEGHPFDLPVSELWAAAEPVPGRGDGVYTLALHHQMLHLSLHFAWSHMLATGFWRTFRDLGTLIGTGRVEWGEFVRLARRSRGGSGCYWTFRLMRALGRLDAPEAALAALRPPGSALRFGWLERHFISDLVTVAGCPSVRLRELLWELAMRPGWSGHGESRPWSRTPLFGAATGAGDSPAHEAGGSVAGRRLAGSAWRHLLRTRRWAPYLRWLVASLATPARRASVSRAATSSSAGRSAPTSSESTSPSR